MFKKDLNTILGTFTKVQRQLEAFIADETGKAAAKSIAAADLAHDARLHKEAAEEASKVQKNISKLINA